MESIGKPEKKIFIDGEFTEGADGEWRKVPEPRDRRGHRRGARSAPRRTWTGPLGPRERPSKNGSIPRRPSGRRCCTGSPTLWKRTRKSWPNWSRRNVGKPISSARGELPYIVDNLRFFAGVARGHRGQVGWRVQRGYTRHDPSRAVGVVGQIAPWNYPLMMAVLEDRTCLAAGNTVVLEALGTDAPPRLLRMAELAANIFPPRRPDVVTGDGEPWSAPRHRDAIPAWTWSP